MDGNVCVFAYNYRALEIGALVHTVVASDM